MDNLCAIGFGLGVRFVIDSASHHDLKVTGTLVGLWEGVVMQHFLRKMPTSFDPYVAYGVRLFIDFLVTESLTRLVLVLVWTGLGVVLADIAPALWIDAGLRRIWRRFRRDLYLMSRSMPSVPYPRTRTVRFSPSQTASVISSPPPSVFTTITQDPTLLSVLTPTLRKRHVPGAFPADVSETETDIGSILGLGDAPSESSTVQGTAQQRFTSYMGREFDIRTETDISSDMNDLDEANLSSSASSVSTESPDPSAVNPSDIPDYDDDEEVMTTEKKPDESDRETTPKQSNVALLPTPPDSFALHHHDEPDGVQPPTEVPIMPDEDWEEISRREASPTPPFATKDLPPTPPAKDDPHLGTSSVSPLPQQAPQQVPHTNDISSTSSAPQPAHEDDAAHHNDKLIDFTDEFPTSSQQQPLSGPSHAPGTPPPRFSAEFADDLSFRQSGSPPPPFQDMYGQDEPNQNDSHASRAQLATGDQNTPNNINTHFNANTPNQNDTGDATTKNTTAADIGAGQSQGENDQPQVSSTTPPVPRQNALNKAKTKETIGNGGNGAAKRQRNKSRSGQSTPKPGSKPTSDDEGESTLSTGPKIQQVNPTQGASTVWGQRGGNPVDKGVGEDMAGSTAGNSSSQQAGLTPNRPPDSAQPRSVTFDQSATDNKSGLNREPTGGQGTGSPAAGDSPGTKPNLENPDTAKADATNANRANHTLQHSPETTQATASPSTIAIPNPTTSRSEETESQETSGDRLIQALELRKEMVALDAKIVKLKGERKVAAERQDGTASKEASVDDAMKEKEKLNKKIGQLLAAHNPNTRDEITLTASDDVISIVGEALACLLLKNKAQLTVEVAKASKVQQKQALSSLLTKHDLDYNVDVNNARMTFVSLPHTSR